MKFSNSFLNKILNGFSIRTLLSAILIQFITSGAFAFCVQTFNVYAPIYAPAKKARLSRLQSEITRGEQCEVLHFQEFWLRGGRREMVTELSREGWATFEGPYFHGLLSAIQGPLTQSYSGLFRKNSDGALDKVRKGFGVKKGYNLIQSKLGGHSVDLVNVHLHPTSQVVRLAQILQLLELRLTRLGQPMVMTGDFNLEPGSLDYWVLVLGLNFNDSLREVDSYRDGQCTYCDRNPYSWLKGDHIFDYILFSRPRQNSISLTLREALINFNSDSPLSDHYGVRGQFQWENFSQHDEASLQKQRERVSYLMKNLEIVVKIFKKEGKKYHFEYKHAQNLLERLSRFSPQDPLVRLLTE